MRKSQPARPPATAAVTRTPTVEARSETPAATTRDQLIVAATRIFAAKGFAGATTREICQAAGANIASIHYHFGDKAGLYRAVLTRPIHAVTEQFGRFDDPALPFEEAIRRVLAPFIGISLGEDSNDLHVTRLHLREMLEPSPIFREVVAQNILPQHNALAALLASHCGLEAPDADLHHLAFAIVALAKDLCISREYMRLIAPEVLEREAAAARVLDRLVAYAGALLAEERRRRALAAEALP